MDSGTILVESNNFRQYYYMGGAILVASLLMSYDIDFAVLIRLEIHVTAFCKTLLSLLVT